jgi:Holliday junction resolvase RusA-like endonuclease
MEPEKTSVIEIMPSTNVRSTQGDRWLFSVSDEYLADYDKKKVDVDGKLGRNAARKRQLEKYNAFKEEVRHLANKQGFTMPSGFFAIWFYVPHPKSWRKAKIKENLYKEHMSTPDWDNYAKAFFDALMPRKAKSKGEKGSDDRRIHCGAIFKVWVLPSEACIKVLEYDRSDFMEAFKHGHPSYRQA